MSQESTVRLNFEVINKRGVYQEIRICSGPVNGHTSHQSVVRAGVGTLSSRDRDRDREIGLLIDMPEKRTQYRMNDFLSYIRD